MFLLAISVGRVWSVHSALEFSAIKKNLRIMSDIERIFWTVLLRMASRVFLFFTPSDSSLVRNSVVCMEGASNSRCEVGLKGFPVALLSVTEMVNEASRHLGSFTAANWVSFDFNVSYSSCRGYSLINTLKFKKWSLKRSYMCSFSPVPSSLHSLH